MHQHDMSQRPSSSIEADFRIESDPTELHVLAKRVMHDKDIACWITVRQTAHLGSGTFSDVYLGSVRENHKSVNNFASTSSIEKASIVAVAIKKLWPDCSREDMQIITHRLLHHHNVVKLLYYYVCIHPKTKEVVWTLLLEPMPSTILHEHTRLSEQNRIMRLTYIKVRAADV